MPSGFGRKNPNAVCHCPTIDRFFRCTPGRCREKLLNRAMLHLLQTRAAATAVFAGRCRDHAGVDCADRGADDPVRLRFAGFVQRLNSAGPVGAERTPPCSTSTNLVAWLAGFSDCASDLQRSTILSWTSSVTLPCIAVACRMFARGSVVTFNASVCSPAVRRPASAMPVIRAAARLAKHRQLPPIPDGGKALVWGAAPASTPMEQLRGKIPCAWPGHRSGPRPVAV